MIDTLEDIANLGLDLRVWCYRCARATELDAQAIVARFEARRWPMALAAARPRFRCIRCRSADHVLLLPASPKTALERTWAQDVAAFFHANRAAQKRLRRERG